MPSLSVPSRFKPRHRDVFPTRLRGRRRRQGRGSNDGANGKHNKVTELAFTMFPELQVRPKVIEHAASETQGNSNKINDVGDVDPKGAVSKGGERETAKSGLKGLQRPFRVVAPSLGSLFHLSCVCIDIDHVLDVEEEFDNQVFLQAKAARILKRKAVDMKQLTFGQQLGEGGV
jgi:hypothetical protein